MSTAKSRSDEHGEIEVLAKFGAKQERPSARANHAEPNRPGGRRTSGTDTTTKLMERVTVLEGEHWNWTERQAPGPCCDALALGKACTDSARRIGGTRAPRKRPTGRPLECKLEVLGQRVTSSRRRCPNVSAAQHTFVRVSRCGGLDGSLPPHAACRPQRCNSYDRDRGESRPPHSTRPLTV